MYKVIGLFLLFIISGGALAEQIVGKVVGVTDGDTVTLLTGQKEQVKVRLAAIDAPEKSQSFGAASKKTLSDLCFGYPAVVDVHGKDKYGRTIGDLTCDGFNASEEQIQAGMAWVYRQYSNDEHLISLEDEAKSKSLGIWSEAAPIPPWEFRRGAKSPASGEGKGADDSADKGGAGFSCGGKSKCGQMDSCEEARFYLKKCGLSRLDRDHDGIPCESICGN